MRRKLLNESNRFRGAHDSANDGKSESNSCAVALVDVVDVCSRPVAPSRQSVVSTEAFSSRSGHKIARYDLESNSSCLGDRFRGISTCGQQIGHPGRPKMSVSVTDSTLKR